MEPAVVEHLERHLGRMAGGWGAPGTVQVASFADAPEPGVVTYATLGLGHHVLALPGGRQVRQELLFAAHERFPGAPIAAMLAGVARQLLEEHRALLRGELLGPWASVVHGLRARALYATVPVMFPDGLATCAGTTPPTVFVWLLPLPLEDAERVRREGWSSFEDRLEGAAIDLWDPDRAGLAT